MYIFQEPFIFYQILISEFSSIKYEFSFTLEFWFIEQQNAMTNKLCKNNLKITKLLKN